MSIKNLIKNLIDVEVDTEDILELFINPESHIKSPEELEKIRDLIDLLELCNELEVNPYA